MITKVNEWPPERELKETCRDVLIRFDASHPKMLHWIIRYDYHSNEWLQRENSKGHERHVDKIQHTARCCNINIHVQHGHVLKIKLNASISIFKIRYAYEGSFGRCKMPDEPY